MVPELIGQFHPILDVDFVFLDSDHLDSLVSNQLQKLQEALFSYFVLAQINYFYLRQRQNLADGRYSLVCQIVALELKYADLLSSD